jgi:predicted transcriptional regulator of viral defense system
MQKRTDNVLIGCSNTVTSIAPRQLPDHLLSQGVSTFTTRDAQELLEESSPAAVRRALSRLRTSGQVFSPAQGFWVVIPPEYRSWGVVPAERFIDEMMRALGRVYYVALLSAASVHGAAHQAPQVFQVMCAPPLRDRAVARVRLRFFSGRHVAGAPTEPRTVATGTMRVATQELTVIDMVALPGESGGYGNVATVLGELGDLDGSSLATLASPRDRGLARRVGWLVEHFGHCDELTPLREAAAPDEGEPTLLRAGAGRRGRVDRTWGIRVNTDVQPDL